MIGKGHNQAITFSFEAPAEGEKKVPLLEIRLNDDRLVQMPLDRVRNAMYSLRVGEEQVKVFMGRSLIRVVDSSRKILVEQKYTPVYNQR